MCLLVYAMYPVVNHEATVQNTKVAAANLKYLKEKYQRSCERLMTSPIWLINILLSLTEQTIWGEWLPECRTVYRLPSTNSKAYTITNHVVMMMMMIIRQNIIIIVNVLKQLDVKTNFTYHVLNWE